MTECRCIMLYILLRDCVNLFLFILNAIFCDIAEMTTEAIWTKAMNTTVNTRKSVFRHKSNPSSNKRHCLELSLPQVLYREKGQ